MRFTLTVCRLPLIAPLFIIHFSLLLASQERLSISASSSIRFRNRVGFGQAANEIPMVSQVIAARLSREDAAMHGLCYRKEVGDQRS